MMITTGGPALRGLGRQVENYLQHGEEWEDVDSGLLLLVNTVIKYASFRPHFNEASAQLHKDLRDDGLAGLYIVEGAKDDDRCGIGIHAENAAVLEMVDAWGRNQ